MQELKLTPTSFIVLGLIDAAGESTPYELKQLAAAGVANFWTLQHAQLYSEPERLAGAGYLKERREEGGRRRRHYSLTAKGRKALAAWRNEPTDAIYELRDLSLLKLFFGGDPQALAEAQLKAHRAKLKEYEGLRKVCPPGGMLGALESGIGHERESVRFWEKLAAQ